MKNTGTLIISPIRPNDDRDPIASAFSNEIKGGNHAYETLAERNAIIEARRDWSMLVTVYNDGSNNDTYILKYNKVDTNINNNANWEIFILGSTLTIGQIGGPTFSNISSMTFNNGVSQLISGEVNIDIIGATGAQGPQGDIGPAGTSGTSGIDGTNGTSGTDGSTGPTGPSGTSGISGTSGSNGTSGINGSTGPAGPSGTSGTNGSSGTSSGLDVGSTAITGGTSSRILYNNSGILGEYLVTGTGSIAVLQTTPTFITSIISPIIIGGAGTTSSLILRSTSNTGTTNADIIFQTGTNGSREGARILNDGSIKLLGPLVLGLNGALGGQIKFEGVTSGEVVMTVHPTGDNLTVTSQLVVTNNIIGNSCYFFTTLTARPNYLLNSSGSYYGHISNINSTTWGLGYGVSSTANNLFSLIWNDTSNIGINTSSIDASAVLDVVSTAKGFLPPRMTDTQMNAISAPAKGLIVYNTTADKHYGYNGAWVAFY